MVVVTGVGVFAVSGGETSASLFALTLTIPVEVVEILPFVVEEPATVVAEDDA